MAHWDSAGRFLFTFATFSLHVISGYEQNSSGLNVYAVQIIKVSSLAAWKSSACECRAFIFEFLIFVRKFVGVWNFSDISGLNVITAMRDEMRRQKRIEECHFSDFIEKGTNAKGIFSSRANLKSLKVPLETWHQGNLDIFWLIYIIPGVIEMVAVIVLMKMDKKFRWVWVHKCTKRKLGG